MRADAGVHPLLPGQRQHALRGVAAGPRSSAQAATARSAEIGLASTIDRTASCHSGLGVSRRVKPAWTEKVRPARSSRTAPPCRDRHGGRTRFASGRDG